MNRLCRLNEMSSTYLCNAFVDIFGALYSVHIVVVKQVDMRVILYIVYFLCVFVIRILYYSYVAVTNSIVKLLNMQNSLWSSFNIYWTSFIRSKSLHNCFFTFLPEILISTSNLVFQCENGVSIDVESQICMGAILFLLATPFFLSCFCCCFLFRLFFFGLLFTQCYAIRNVIGNFLRS